MKRLIFILCLTVLFFSSCDVYNRIMKKEEPSETEISQDILAEITGETKPQIQDTNILTVSKKELKKMKKEQDKRDKLARGDTLNFAEKFWYALFPKTIEREKNFPLMYKETPKSILVLYPWNRSKRDDASEIFLTNITKALSLRGYYIPSAINSFNDYRADTLFSSQYIPHSKANELGQIYGVDAVLYVTIYSLNKNWWSTSITSSAEYHLISTKSLDTLFFRKTEFIYDTPKPAYKPNKKSEIFNMDIDREVPFFGLGYQMTNYVFIDFPFGPYHKKHLKDKEKFSHPRIINYKINMRLDY